MKYSEITQKDLELKDCFFAFSNSQYEQGIKENNLEGKKIMSGGQGLYGTKEGLDDMWQQMINKEKYITENCTPQEVYGYEFDNHECGYTMDDREAYEIVVNIFGEERAKEVKRRYAYDY